MDKLNPQKNANKHYILHYKILKFPQRGEKDESTKLKTKVAQNSSLKITKFEEAKVELKTRYW